jgi:hypothetical protein
MAHRHIIKINITYIHIISNKLIHNSVYSPNSSLNSKFSLLRPILNPTMIISTLPLQPIFKFIGHLIHPLIHNSQPSYNFIFPSLWCHVIAWLRHLQIWKKIGYLTRYIYIYIYIYSLPTPSLVYSPLVFHSRIHDDLQDTLRQEDNTLELINDMGN